MPAKTSLGPAAASSPASSLTNKPAFGSSSAFSPLKTTSNPAARPASPTTNVASPKSPASPPSTRRAASPVTTAATTAVSPPKPSAVVQRAPSPTLPLSKATEAPSDIPEAVLVDGDGAREDEMNQPQLPAEVVPSSPERDSPGTGVPLVVPTTPASPPLTTEAIRWNAEVKDEDL